MNYYLFVSCITIFLGLANQSFEHLAERLYGVSDTDSDDEIVVYHPNQYFVELDTLLTDLEKLSLLSEFNSIEVWEDDDVNIALWQVVSFPFTNPGGEMILDINDIVTSSKKKTQIRSSNLNVRQVISDTVYTVAQSCFDIHQYTSAHGDENVRISILDTGISDLSDNSNANFNYSITNYTGYDYVNNDSIPEDDHGHGSHIAGIIHSITSGLQPMNSKISFDIRKTHDSLGQAFMSNVVLALLDAVDNDADVINLSFSLNDIYADSIFYPLKNAIEHAASEGVLIVAAAGNEQQDNDQLNRTAIPASFPLDNIISVGAADCDHKLASFTNYGAGQVDILALGVGIPGPDLTSTIVSLSGTSQSTAIVTAVAALRGTFLPDFEYQAVKCAILSTARHYTDMADRVSTEGELNPFAALSSDGLSCNAMSPDPCSTSYTNFHVLNGISPVHQMYETQLPIHSLQFIPSEAHITFDSHAEVVLFPGFEIGVNAQLSVHTDGCDH